MEMNQFVNSVIEKVMDRMFTNDMLTTVKSILDRMSAVLSQAQIDGGAGTIKSLYDFIATIGFVVLTLLFCISIYEQAVAGEFTFESFVKTAVRAIIGALAIEYGLTIMEGIIKFSDALVTLFMKVKDRVPSGNITNYTLMLSNIQAFLDSLSDMTKIGTFFQVMVPWLLSWATEIVVMFIGVARMIELLVRGIMAPIALADMFGRDMNPHAVIYVKKFFAVCLQGFCILAIVFASSVVSGAIMDPNNSNGSASLQNAKTQLDALTQNQAKDAINASGVVDDIASISMTITGMKQEDQVKLVESARQAKLESLQPSIAIGKPYFQNVFSNTNMVAFCAIEVAELIAVLKSRDIANLLCGVA